MKKFRTLRGFLDGYEPDECTYFAYSASLRIWGDSLDLDGITDRIGVAPTRTHLKTDIRSPHSPAFGKDAWFYTAPVPKERPLEEHITVLWEAIRPARDYLLMLKKTANIDVFLGYRSNHDFAGIEVPHKCLEMFTSLEVPFGLSIIVG
jgi:Domain of unknown function (DUF4279)